MTDHTPIHCSGYYDQQGLASVMLRIQSHNIVIENLSQQDLHEIMGCIYALLTANANPTQPSA
jgi:hypothetical protein